MNVDGGGGEARFAFGRNWRRFLARIDDARVAEAERALGEMLGKDTLGGASVLDVGSGSGLSSLAARRLGARVRSFDVDHDSVRCTEELRQRCWGDDADWLVEQGSVLDVAYLGSLGTFDVVYSWGVLHHTGAMWEAMANIAPLVRPGGRLFVALYNDQGPASRVWRVVKRAYVRGPAAARAVIVGLAAVYFYGPVVVRDGVRGRPFERFRTYRETRGMSALTDLVDWVGGYPFEVASVGAVFDFYRSRGFTLEALTTTRGVGCNEFVFRREDSPGTSLA